MKPDWLGWAQQLMAIAQNGLAYSESEYDRGRYEQIREIAAQIAAAQTNGDAQQITGLFANEPGYTTPKVDQRAVIFDGDRVLLTRERDDGRWTLPGGWADIGDLPSESVVREVWEETGYTARSVRLLALYDHDHPRHGHEAYPFHSYKAFFLCEITGGEAAETFETDGVAYFPVDALPPISLTRVTESQIQRMYELYCHPELGTDFD